MFCEICCAPKESFFLDSAQVLELVELEAFEALSYLVDNILKLSLDNRVEKNGFTCSKGLYYHNNFVKFESTYP